MKISKLHYLIFLDKIEISDSPLHFDIYRLVVDQLKSDYNSFNDEIFSTYRINLRFPFHG